MLSDLSIRTRLIDHAVASRQRAYAPYSQFFVGAALLASNGQIFSGCNVENASYGATICAERVAGSTAVAAGIRDWMAIAIATVGGVSPCGICRQFLVEFAPEMTVLMIDTESGNILERKIDELLPDRFIFEGPR